MSGATSGKPRYLLVLAMAAASAFVGCGVSLTRGPGGDGIQLAAEILGLRFTFTIGGAPIFTAPNESAEAAVGFRLFEQTPTMVPPSGTMSLPSSAVGVGQRLAKTLGNAPDLPLNGSGTITFRVASGTLADLCNSAVLLAEFDLVYSGGTVAILNEDISISPEALAIIATNDVTICIEITADFAAGITLGDFSFSFGGSPVLTGSTTASLLLVNNDTAQNIHILLPGQDFPDNRLTPGASLRATAEIAAGTTVSVRAGRNGSVLATTTCPAALGSNYSATVSWDGLSLTCEATQDAAATGDDRGTVIEEEPPVTPGTIIQVPVANPDGFSLPAPVTSTFRGVDYGIVEVLYKQTVFSPEVPPALTSMDVDLATLGLESVSRIYMIVHSSFVPDLPNGVDMGTLTVSYAEGGPPTILDFILGDNTAEWSYDRPENAPVPHSLADTLYTFTTTIDSDFTYEAREYAEDFTVDATRTISCIELDIPSGPTFAALRPDPTELSATYAAQYIAAMTFEGRAGMPSAIGGCPLDGGDVEPTCVTDSFCNPLCPEGDDPDCVEICAADGDCNEDCPAETPDPDCVIEATCENTACADTELCCQGVCETIGEPTAGICPPGFEVNFGVFSPDIRNVVFDRYEPSAALAFAGSCVYVRDDGGGGEVSLSIFYTGGFCGVVDDDGDGVIVVGGSVGSTVRTISASASVTVIATIVDPILLDLVQNAVAAQVGAACCTDE